MDELREVYTTYTNSGCFCTSMNHSACSILITLMLSIHCVARY